MRSATQTAHKGMQLEAAAMPAAMPARAARVRDSKRVLWDASPMLVHRAKPSIRRCARPRAELKVSIKCV